MIINIEMQYFLGIMFGLLAVAWYSSHRFTSLEIDMKWVKDILHELKISSDNTSNPAFGSLSPVNLTAVGEKWIVESGLKDYIDTHKNELVKLCEEKKLTNPYEVQKHIFKVFDTLDFEPTFDDNLKRFAFEKGSSMNIVRRVGAIYFRSLCLSEFGMNKEDIDKHDPEKK